MPKNDWKIGEKKLGNLISFQMNLLIFPNPYEFFELKTK